MDEEMVRKEKKKRREEEMGSSDKQGRIVLAVNNKRLLLGDAGLHPHMHGTQQLCLITGKQLDEHESSACVCELACSIFEPLPRRQQRPARPDCIESSP
jgi:hypothetical protein